MARNKLNGQIYAENIKWNDYKTSTAAWTSLSIKWSLYLDRVKAATDVL